jgi:hypothetical protein
VKPDDKGAISIPEMAAGDCYVAMCSNDGGLIGLFKSKIEKGKVADTALSIPAAGAVEGVLIDENGKPKADDEVYLTPLTAMTVPVQRAAVQNVWRDFCPVAITDSNGGFSFPKVPAGEYVLTSANFSLYRVTVKEGETSKAEIHIAKTVKPLLSIKAAAGEKPLTELFVRIVEVCPDGTLLPVEEQHGGLKYTMAYGAPFPVGKYVFLVGELSDKRGVIRPVEIGPDTTTIEMEISWPQGTCAITGKIAVDPAAESIRPKVLFAMGEKSFATAYSEPDGSFRFTGLPPGKYKIFERRFTFDFLCVNGKDYFSVKEVTVEEGKNLEGVEIP